MKQCNLRYEFSNKRSTSKSTEGNQVSSPPQNAPRFEIFGTKRPIPAPAVYRPGNISATDTSFRSRRDSAFFRADRHPTSAQTTTQETAAPCHISANNPLLAHCFELFANIQKHFANREMRPHLPAVRKRVDDAGKLREVLQRAALLCREAQRWLIFGESVDKRGFPARRRP